MTPIPQPTHGQVQMQVLHGVDRFIAWIDGGDVDGKLLSVESQHGLEKKDRTDQILQMRMRIRAKHELSDPETSERVFTDWLAAAILWLTLNHYEHGATLRNVLDRRLEQSLPVVISVTIGESPGAVPGTAWAFHIDSDLVDAREVLARTPAGTNTVIGPQ